MMLGRPFCVLLLIAACVAKPTYSDTSGAATTADGNTTAVTTGGALTVDVAPTSTSTTGTSAASTSTTTGTTGGSGQSVSARVRLREVAGLPRRRVRQRHLSRHLRPRLAVLPWHLPTILHPCRRDLYLPRGLRLQQWPGLAVVPEDLRSPRSRVRAGRGVYPRVLRILLLRRRAGPKPVVRGMHGVWLRRRPHVCRQERCHRVSGRGCGVLHPVLRSRCPDRRSELPRRGPGLCAVAMAVRPRSRVRAHRLLQHPAVTRTALAPKPGRDYPRRRITLPARRPRRSRAGSTA